MRQGLFALVLAAVLLAGCGQAGTGAAVASGDDALARAFNERTSGQQVTGMGTVTRILPDDNEGGRHQRFILTLASGQTLLIAHNIDVAPRVEALKLGDVIEFAGVYEWNDEGGIVHWTHRDPDGEHQAGWLKRDGVTYL